MNGGGSGGRLPSTLVRLTGPAPAGTLVFMPDMGGSVFYARALVGEIGAQVGCLGARLDPALSADLGRLSVPDLGRRLAQDIAGAALPRPLHLAGFSFAGYVAFEVARHLTALGVPVESLWLFDSEVLRRLPAFRPWHAPLAEARRAVSFTRLNWRVMLGGRRDPDVLHAYDEVPMYLRDHPEGCRAIIRGLYPAATQYRPAPWPDPGLLGRAVLVRAVLEKTHRGLPDDLGWRHLIPRCDVVSIRSKHLGLLSDPDAVAELAGVMRGGLAAAIEKTVERTSA